MYPFCLKAICDGRVRVCMCRTHNRTTISPSRLVIIKSVLCRVIEYKLVSSAIVTFWIVCILIICTGYVCYRCFWSFRSSRLLHLLKTYTDKKTSKEETEWRIEWNTETVHLAIMNTIKMSESEDFGWTGVVLYILVFSFVFFLNFVHKCDQTDWHHVLSRVRDLTFELKGVILHSEMV